ncbi:hypothetical protein C0J52_14871 [Blattella germanica]|nr:hypothetical protein C0J52_14871 [Blattella germanica]
MTITGILSMSVDATSVRKALQQQKQYRRHWSPPHRILSTPSSWECSNLSALPDYDSQRHGVGGVTIEQVRACDR